MATDAPTDTPDGLAFSLAPDPVLDRLTRLHPKEIDLSLGRVLDLLSKLGDPHLKTPPVIHVAGTNGKGSTVAFLRAVLEAAGLTVHVYTSPHLVRFAERIRLAGSIIDETLLTMLLEEVERANGDDPITFFEATTATAFLAFAQVPADVLLLETGLGGRLDATNVVPNPLACVLTPISHDHERFLGTDLAGIAAEKAAIFKPGAVAVSTLQPPEAARPIEAAAQAAGVSVRWQGRDWTVRGSASGGAAFEGRSRTWHLPPLGLAGEHQLTNAGAALAALEDLPFTLPDFAVAEGLAAVDWPARAHRLSAGPLVDRLPHGWDLWLDGGHNPAAAHVLTGLMARWPGREVLLICGMMDAKDHRTFLATLAPKIARMIAVSIPGEKNALPADVLAASARAAGMAAVDVASGVGPALDTLIGDWQGDKPPVVLIAGSLYLAGSVLRENR